MTERPGQTRTRPALYKRYTAPSHLPSLLISSLSGVVSQDVPPSSDTGGRTFTELHQAASTLAQSPLEASRSDLTQPTGSSSYTMTRASPNDAQSQTTNIHPLSPRILRKSSQPDLLPHISSQKRRPTHLPLPSTSFLSLSTSISPSRAKHASSPPPSATRSVFQIDKSRTRKQSLIPPSPRWSEMMPSIQGVMNKSSSHSIKSQEKERKREREKERGRNKDKDCKGSGASGSAKSSGHGREQVSEVEFAKKRSVRERGRRDTLELPMMPLPIASHPHTNARPHMRHGASGEHRWEDKQPNTREQAQHLPCPATVTPITIGTRTMSPPATSHARQDHASVQNTDGDWDIISLSPPPSYPPRTSSISPHPHQTASLTNVHVDPETSSLSSELDLRAVEVLEHLSSYLQAGWGDDVLEQHRSATLQPGADSMRSWRQTKKAKERSSVRPLSEQGWKRHIPVASGLASPPPVPQRHSSRPPPLPIGTEDSAGSAGSVKESLSPSRKEGTPSQEAMAPLPIVTILQDVETERKVMSPTTPIPVHLRPLPPLPSASNTPPRSFIPTRLLRPKRNAISLQPPPPPRALSSITIANTSSVAAKPVKSSVPGKQPRLVARDEPPAALGKRSTETSERRRGMTALSFLAAEDPIYGRMTSARSSELSLTVGLAGKAGKSRPGRSSIDQATRYPRAESPVVSHIIPPEELQRIGESREATTSSASSNCSDESDTRSYIARYGGSELPSKSTLSLHRDTAVRHPEARARQSGPVVPPRKGSQQGISSLRSVSFPSPLDLSAASNVNTLNRSPLGLTPPPRPRARGLKSPETPKSPVTPAASGVCATERTVRKPNLSALTLPTNDRPSTLGGWDSPPGTPSPVERTFGHNAWREERTPVLGHSPIAPDGEFGDLPRAGENRLTPTLGHFGLGQRRKGSESEEEVAVTPRSVLDMSGSTAVVGTDGDGEMDVDPETPETMTNLDKLESQWSLYTEPEVGTVIRAERLSLCALPAVQARRGYGAVDTCIHHEQERSDQLEDKTTARPHENTSDRSYSVPGLLIHHFVVPASATSKDIEPGQRSCSREGSDEADNDRWQAEAREARRLWLMSKPKRSTGPTTVPVDVVV